MLQGPVKVSPHKYSPSSQEILADGRTLTGEYTARFFSPGEPAIDGAANPCRADTVTIRELVIATGLLRAVAGLGGVSGSADGAGAAALLPVTSAVGPASALASGRRPRTAGRAWLATAGSLFVLIIFAGAASCAYRPSPGNGDQTCAEGTGKVCPTGFYCASQLCWRNDYDGGVERQGTGGSGTGGTSGTGGAIGTGTGGGPVVGTGGNPGTGGTGSGGIGSVPIGGAGGSSELCPQPTFPVLCPALGGVPILCWSAGTVCSTIMNCNGAWGSCSSASMHVDCPTGSCVSGAPLTDAQLGRGRTGRAGKR